MRLLGKVQPQKNVTILTERTHWAGRKGWVVCSHRGIAQGTSLERAGPGDAVGDKQASLMWKERPPLIPEAEGQGGCRKLGENPGCPWGHTCLAKAAGSSRPARQAGAPAPAHPAHDQAFHAVGSQVWQCREVCSDGVGTGRVALRDVDGGIHPSQFKCKEVY